MSEQGAPVAERHFLSFEEIEAAPDLKSEDVFVPQWNGWVTVRELNAGEAIDVRQAATVDGEVDEKQALVLLLAAAVASPPLTVEKAARLMRKSSDALGVVAAVAQRLNGIGAAQTEIEQQFRGVAGETIPDEPVAGVEDPVPATVEVAGHGDS